MSLVSFGCLDLHGDRLAADVAIVPVVSGHLGLARAVRDGISMGARGQTLAWRDAPENPSALVVTGCLLLSRTVFDQFGVADGGPDSAVDIGCD
jgi:hypothetical protein